MRKFLAMTVGIMVLSVGGVGLKSQEANAAQVDQSGVTQNWDKNIPSASRFTVLAAFGGAAVRDNNTGLVWEKAPDASTTVWGLATMYCLQKPVPLVGGTRGWRLPSVVELVSLIDPSLPPPFVPPSVFTGVLMGNATYLAATSGGPNLDSAYGVSFTNGFVAGFIKPGNEIEGHAWCVRGPMQESVY